MKNNLYMFAGLFLLVAGLASPSFGNVDATAADDLSVLENAESSDVGGAILHDPWYFLGCVFTTITPNTSVNIWPMATDTTIISPTTIITVATTPIIPMPASVETDSY